MSLNGSVDLDRLVLHVHSKPAGSLREPLLFNVRVDSDLVDTPPDVNIESAKSQQANLVLGGLIMLFSAAILSINSLIVKEVESNGISAFELVGIRCFGQLLIVSTILIFRKTPVRDWFGSRRNYKLLALRGSVGVSGYALYLFALSRLPLSDATALWFTSPIFTGVIAYFALSEDFGLVELTTTIVGICGIMFIVRPEIIFGEDEDLHGLDQSDTSRLVGIIAVLISSFLVGCTYTIIRKLGTLEHFLIQLNWFSLGGIIAGPIGAAVEGYKMPNSIDWAKIIGQVFLGSIGQMTITKSLQLIPAVVGGNIRNIDVVFSFVWDIIILHHQVQYFSIIGALLILSSSFLISLNRFRRNKQAAKTEEEQKLRQLREIAHRESLAVH